MRKALFTELFCKILGGQSEYAGDDTEIVSIVIAKQSGKV